MRKCKVNGSEAFFHKWDTRAYVLEPSAMIGGQHGGQVQAPVAIVEFYNGVVKEAAPNEIKFDENPKQLIIKELEEKIIKVEENDIDCIIRNRHFREAIEIVKKGLT